MDRFLVSIILLANVIGPMTCASDGVNGTVAAPEAHKAAVPQHPEPKPPTTHAPQPPTPSTTTTTTTTTLAPSSSTIPPSPPNTTTPSPSSTTSSTTTLSPKTTTPSPHPAPAPSDRKFEAFSFIGGFVLAIGLVGIGVLSWKLYVTRRENVYHTL